MAVKYSRSPVASVPAINNELQKIQVALEDAVSRKGDGPNQLEATVDANSQRIINLPEPVTNTEPVRKADFDELGSSLQSVVYTAVQDAEDATSDANTAANRANNSADDADDAANAALQALADFNTDKTQALDDFYIEKNSALNQFDNEKTNALNNFENQAELTLQSTGWFPVAGSFQTGVTVTAKNQVLFDEDTNTHYSWGGALPKVVPPGSTVASAGGVGVDKWIDRGDATLRSELNNPAESANRVARMEITADSLKDLVTAPRIANRRYSVKGFYAGTDAGGGTFYWNASRDKADHNGGTVIDPDRVNVWDGTQGDLATLFEAGSGSGCFERIVRSSVTPDMFGGIKNDNTFDNSACIQKTLSASQALSLPAHLPAGDWYIAETIVVGTRATWKGVNALWSPNPSRTSNLYWIGDPGKEMVRAATAPFLTEATMPVSGLNVQDIYLDGQNVAGVGFYGALCRDDSTFKRIVVRRCNLFGILFEGDTFYATFDELIARNNAGVGIAFGYNYNNVFSNNRFNGVRIGYLRAANNGQKYHATDAPTGFDINDNPRGGCGIYCRLKASSHIEHILSENNYGPGLVNNPAPRSRTTYGSIYLESNAEDSVSDGVAPVDIEFLQFADTNTNNYTTVETLWFENLDDSYLYYKQIGGVPGPLTVSNIGGEGFSIDSDGITVIPFRVKRNEGTLKIASGKSIKNYDGGDFAGRFVATPSGRVTSGNRDAHVSLLANSTINGWESGEKIKLTQMRITLSPLRSSATTIIMNVQAATGTSDPQVQVRNKVYSLSVIAARRWNVPDVLHSLELIHSHNGTFTSGGGILDDFTPTVEFTAQTDGSVLVEVFVEITSSGNQARNSVSFSGTTMGSGLSGGGTMIPSRNLEF